MSPFETIYGKLFLNVLLKWDGKTRHKHVNAELFWQNIFLTCILPPGRNKIIPYTYHIYVYIFENSDFTHFGYDDVTLR